MFDTWTEWELHLKQQTYNCLYENGGAIFENSNRFVDTKKTAGKRKTTYALLSKF
jgi:hypothetical protein